MNNKIFAAIDRNWDGIQHIVLFSAEHLAKTYVRKQNKELGFNAYEVKEMEIHNEITRNIK